MAIIIPITIIKTKIIIDTITYWGTVSNKLVVKAVEQILNCINSTSPLTTPLRVVIIFIKSQCIKS